MFDAVYFYAVYLYIFFPFLQYLSDFPPPQQPISCFFLSHEERKNSHYTTWNLICIGQLLFSMGPALECGSYANVTSLNKADNCSLSSYHSWIPSWLCTHLHSFMLGFCLAWACAGLVCAVTISVSSYVFLPCCV